MTRAHLAFLTLLEACLSSCGGGFSDADALVMQDSVNTAVSLQADCARDSDGGTCTPATVRAKSRQLLCGAENLLFHHDKSIPDAGLATGIVCAPVDPR